MRVGVRRGGQSGVLRTRLDVKRSVKTTVKRDVNNSVGRKWDVNNSVGRKWDVNNSVGRRSVVQG